MLLFLYVFTAAEEPLTVPDIPSIPINEMKDGGCVASSTHDDSDPTPGSLLEKVGTTPGVQHFKMCIGFILD